ncbi:MAG: hypothetical protein IJU32_07170 [Pyramidobacter sp.]|nr:hypothetical protein [Pyramidobacter sp.]
MEAGVSMTARFTDYVTDDGTKISAAVYYEYQGPNKAGSMRRVKEPRIMELRVVEPYNYWRPASEIVAGEQIGQRVFKNRTEAQKTLDLLAKARGWAKYEEADA